MVPPLSSFVWNYFEKTDREHVECKLCGKVLRYHTCTTNMKSHLKSKHPHTLANHNQRCEITDDHGQIITFSEEVRAIECGEVDTGTEKTVLNYQKLVVPMSMRSVYWKCYGFPASAAGEILTRVKIVCLLCKSVIAYNRNTTNLRMHLQNKHAEELRQLELSAPTPKPKEQKTPNQARAKKKRDPGNNMYATDIEGSLVLGSNDEVMSNETTEEFGSDNQQPRHVRLMIKKREAKTSTTTGKPHMTLYMPGTDDQNCTIESLHPFVIPIESKSVSEVIAEFIVTDMQLPDVVEGRGFQRLIATLRSPCEIPSRNKLVQEVVPRIYDASREMLQETLLSLKTEVSLTVEEWESLSGETYVTFSVCFQQEKMDSLHYKVLSTFHCPATADSLYWTGVLDNMLEEWNISIDKVKAVVCGACRPEVVEAMLQRELVVLPCLVQTIQEVCTRVCFEQDDVREVLAKCRAFIYLVFKNSNALASLRIQDHLMSLEEIPLVSDYPRVWISTYVMLENLIARRQVMSSILDNIDTNTYDKELVTLSEQDWSLVEDVLTVLEPFKVTMMTLSEEKTPLVSLLKPLLWQLNSCHLKAKEEDSMNAQVFKSALKTLLSEKYNEPAVNQLLQVSTSLDPRFKSLPNSAEECRGALEGPIKVASVIEDIGSLGV